MLLPLLLTIQERLEKIFLAETVLTVDAFAGQKAITVGNDADLFAQESMWFKRHFSQIVLYNDAKGDGRKIEGGLTKVRRSGAEIKKVEATSVNQIFLQEPLTEDWLVSDGTKVARAPGGSRVAKIFIDDVRTNKKYPVICIIPVSQSIDWTHLSGTKDNFRIDFAVYVKDDNSPEASIELYRITDALNYALMSNLHLPMAEAEYNFERTSYANVDSINFGKVSVGNTTLKASLLSWQADVYFWRTYITAQGGINTTTPFGKCYGS